jgi:hypothetical protein
VSNCDTIIAFAIKSEAMIGEGAMEVHDPSLCTLNAWLLSATSGISLLVAGAVYLLLG